MIQFEDFKKQFTNSLIKNLPSYATKEEKKAYIEGIDFNDYYEALKIELSSPYSKKTVDGIIQADSYELYMLYPDY